jgi:ferric-dicitrate binding protein FerR (iron transport regulator)
MTGDRLDELASAWSIDDPDPAVRAELEDLLRRDPVARRRFLDHCVAEMALAESLNATTATAGSDRKAVLRLPPMGGTTPHRTWRWAGWAAGIAALLMFTILLFPSSKALQVSAGSLTVAGQTIPSGGRVDLPASTAVAGAEGVTLESENGISLRADPGSAFSVPAVDLVHLDSGQLSLDIDGKRAPPIVIHTAEMQVQVVGTRFSVARRATKTNVAVEQGQVRVTTTGQQVQLVSAGMRVTADASGFAPDAPPSLLQQMIYLADDQTRHVIAHPDQPIRIPAARPFTLRLEVDQSVDALRFRIAGNLDLPDYPRRIEVSRPFDLWGDTDHQPDFSTLPIGSHRLTVTFFADNLGERILETRQFELLVE